MHPYHEYVVTIEDLNTGIAEERFIRVDRAIPEHKKMVEEMVSSMTRQILASIQHRAQYAHTTQNKAPS
jgi:hypothetical protein